MSYFGTQGVNLHQNIETDQNSEFYTAIRECEKDLTTVENHNLIDTRDLEDGDRFWQLELHFPAYADMEVTTTNPNSGSNSMKVTVQNVTSVNWNNQ